MAKPNFTLPNKPAIKSGSILSYNYTDDFTFVPAPLTFNRDSAATRVNEKGLIEEVGYFGPELVQNGDFSEIGPELVTNGDFATDSDWNLQSIATISQNKLIVSNATQNTTIATQSSVAPTQKPCKLQFDIVVNTGSFRILLGSNGTTTTVTESGTYTFYETSGNFGTLTLQARDGGFDGSIDNISVKEVGQNWTFGTGWSVDQENTRADATDAVFNSQLVNSAAIVANKKYKISFDISNYVKGSVIVKVGNASSTEVSGNGSFTFTLTSANTSSFQIATWAGGSGTTLSVSNISVIEVLGDKPRIDYSDSLTEPSLLLEPQSTNLITYSEDFSDSSWNKEGGAIIQSNIASSPDGSINASYLKAPVTTNNTVRITYTFSCTSSQTYVGSIFVKKDNVDFIRMLSTGATSSTLQAFYNVSNGTLGSSGTPAKAAIEDYGNGWYRLSLIIDAVNTSSSATFRIQLAKTDGAVINNFDGTEKNLIWGAQLEALSYPTSYIPTAGATATRLGETANNAGDVNVFNSEEGVLYAEIAALANDGTVRYIALTDGTSNNRATILYYSASNNIRAIVSSNGTNSVDKNYGVSSVLDFHKIAIKYKENDFALWVNGAERKTDTSGNAPIGLNNLSFDVNNVGNFRGKVREIQVFNKALTDRELEILTIQ